MSKTGQYEIPFDNVGNLLHYPQFYGTIEWKDNFEFQDTLVYEGYSRGRSAAYMTFKSMTAETMPAGKTYCMFLKEFNDAVFKMHRGVLTGTFTFIKRGQNYGIRLLSEVP